MNRVSFRAEEVPLPAWQKRAKAYILQILDSLSRDRWDLSVLFCSNNRIRELNSQYRKKNQATDILTFIQGSMYRGRYLAGDIVISLETLEENAAYFGVSLDEELRRLLIHGILHLDNMDHRTNETAEPMLQLQEKILAEHAGVLII